MRVRTSPSIGPDAPDREAEPSSSWSKAASTLMWPASAVAASSSARSPACTEVRLSIRPAANSTPSSPNRAGAAVSAVTTS